MAIQIIQQMSNMKVHISIYYTYNTIFPAVVVSDGPAIMNYLVLYLQGVRLKSHNDLALSSRAKYWAMTTVNGHISNLSYKETFFNLWWSDNPLGDNITWFESSLMLSVIES